MSKICNNCGSTLKDNQKFCTQCGTKYEEEKYKNKYTKDNERNKTVFKSPSQLTENIFLIVVIVIMILVTIPKMLHYFGYGLF